MKTEFMQTVNLLTFELKEKGSNIYHYLKKPLKQSYLFFKHIG